MSAKKGYFKCFRRTGLQCAIDFFLVGLDGFKSASCRRHKRQQGSYFRSRPANLELLFLTWLNRATVASQGL